MTGSFLINGKDPFPLWGWSVQSEVIIYTACGGIVHYIKSRTIDKFSFILFTRLSGNSPIFFLTAYCQLPAPDQSLYRNFHLGFRSLS